jgi:hypothetical protein
MTRLTRSCSSSGRRARAVALAVLATAAALVVPAAAYAAGGTGTTAAGEATRELLEKRYKSAGSKVGGTSLERVGSNTAAHLQNSKGSAGTSTTTPSASTPATGAPSQGLNRSQVPATGAKSAAGATKAPARTTTSPTGAASTPAGGAAAPPSSATAPATSLPRAPASAGLLLGSANHPAARAHAGSGHVSALAIAIAALGALLVLACAAWALARRRAFEPHWWLSMRHSMAEAGHRASGTWAEFSDWARLGR